MSAFLDWKVGDKVVCTKRGGWWLVSGTGGPTVNPQYGEICTISSLVLKDVLCITVDGYHARSLYEARRFRPIQISKTSIEVFNRILLNPHIKVGEDA